MESTYRAAHLTAHYRRRRYVELALIFAVVPNRQVSLPRHIERMSEPIGLCAREVRAAAGWFQFLELALRVFIGRAQRAVNSCRPDISLSRAFGVDLRARYAHVNLDSKRHATRRLWCTLEHDMACRHTIVEPLQTATDIPRRSLERS